MYTENWLEVSLVVDDEMAEAVSDVIARFVSGGVVIESTQITNDISGQGIISGMAPRPDSASARIELRTGRRCGLDRELEAALSPDPNWQAIIDQPILDRY
jgi:hypothetical protein